MLTTLATARIRKLLVEEHKSYEQAQEIAQTEVLACFGISLLEPIAAARMDISRTGEANAALLAISAVMQDRRTEAELSELMAAISNDIRDNGRITVSALKEELLVSGIEIEPDEIRQNLIDRYAELGLKDAEVPDFYDFVDSDGDGELNGANPYLIVSYRQTIGNEGGELDVKVRSNQDWDVVVPAEAEAWLRVVRSSRADNRLTLGVEPNQGAPRTAKIEIRHRNGAMIRYVELTQAGAQVSMRVRLVDALAVGSNSELSLDQVADLVLMGFDEQGRMLFNQAIERISETTLSVAVILPPEQLEERINMTLYTVANDFDTYKDFRGTEDELKTLRSQRNLNQGALPMPRIDVQRYTLLYGRDNPITVPLKLAVAQV
ncbi:MAG: BACON domain-containing protein, partial [Rikenella sp.]|nr:BACON domain-containing protein [Rikenella sp.]